MRTLLFAFVLLLPQAVNTGHYRKVFSGTNCSNLHAYESNQWPAWGSITCTGGCTTGNPITEIPDTIGGNSLFNIISPTYQASAFGTLGAANFNSASSQYMELSSGITTSSSFTMWATIQPTIGGSDGAIFGPSMSQGPEYRIDTNGHQEILEANIKSIGIGTATLTSGSKYTVAVVLNTSTGSWTFYTFNGGSYSVDATGTNSMSFTEPFNYIGFFSGNYFDGLFVDGGYSNTAWGATALNCLAYYSYHTLGV